VSCLQILSVLESYATAYSDDLGHLPRWMYEFRVGCLTAGFSIAEKCLAVAEPGCSSKALQFCA
jgi:hypothetical protein